MTKHISKKLQDYRQIEEIGLANIESLLDQWGVEWRLVPGTKNELDILATWRGDTRFGSCRFNVEKGVGCDFAEVEFSTEDVTKYLGPGFDLSDVDNSQATKKSNVLHLISLVQRIHKNCSYKYAASILAHSLRELGDKLVYAHPDAAKQREENAEQARQKRRAFANDIWNSRAFPYKGTLAERYLERRGIILTRVERGIKFIPWLWRKDGSGKSPPAMVFPIRATPKSEEVKGVHRIYLDELGNKADIPNPKQALGEVKGNAIWFGELDSTLHIAEGPETALSLVVMGHKFVCSAVWAGNLGNLNIDEISKDIPGGLKEVVICGDNDPTGRAAAESAARTYKANKGLIVRTIYPKDPYKDFNDLLKASQRLHTNQ